MAYAKLCDGSSDFGVSDPRVCFGELLVDLGHAGDESGLALDVKLMKLFGADDGPVNLIGRKAKSLGLVIPAFISVVGRRPLHLPGRNDHGISELVGLGG